MARSPSQLRSRFLLTVAALTLSVAVLPTAAQAAKPAPGSFKGKVQEPSYWIKFKVSKDRKWVSGVRAKVWMNCTGNRGAINHPDFLVIPGRVPIDGKGRFSIDDDPDTPGTWTVTGRFKSKRKAIGKLTYSRGSASLELSEFCTTFSDRKWKAKKRR